MAVLPIAFRGCTVRVRMLQWVLHCRSIEKHRLNVYNGLQKLCLCDATGAWGPERLVPCDGAGVRGCGREQLTCRLGLEWCPWCPALWAGMRLPGRWLGTPVMHAVELWLSGLLSCAQVHGVHTSTPSAWRDVQTVWNGYRPRACRNRRRKSVIAISC